MCQLLYARFEFPVNMPGFLDIARTLMALDGTNHDGFGFYIEDEKGPYIWKTDDTGVSVYIPDYARERLARAKFVLAHTRAKTRGEPSPRNSQPFFFKNVVGAHNGTFSTLSGKDDKYSDSRLFYQEFNKSLENVSIRNSGKKRFRPIRKRLQRLFDKHRGTAALIFKIDDHVFFFKDRIRNLHICLLTSEGKEGIIIATNRLTIMALANIIRNMKRAKVGFKVEPVESDILFVITPEMDILRLGQVNISQSYGSSTTYVYGHSNVSRFSGKEIEFRDRVLVEDGKTAVTYLLYPKGSYNVFRDIIFETIEGQIGFKPYNVRMKLPSIMSYDEDELRLIKIIAAGVYTISQTGFEYAAKSINLSVRKEDYEEIFKAVIDAFAYVSLHLHIEGSDEEARMVQAELMFDEMITRLFDKADSYKGMSDALLAATASRPEIEHCDLNRGKKVAYKLFGG